MLNFSPFTIGCKSEILVCGNRQPTETMSLLRIVQRKSRDNKTCLCRSTRTSRQEHAHTSRQPDGQGKKKREREREWVSWNPHREQIAFWHLAKTQSEVHTSFQNISRINKTVTLTLAATFDLIKLTAEPEDSTLLVL